MNSIIKIMLVAMFLLFLKTGFSNTILDSGDQVIIKAAFYDVQIQKNPFGFTVVKNQKPLQQCIRLIGKQKGIEFVSKRVTNIEKRGPGLTLTVETTGTPVILSFQPSDNYLEIQSQTAGELEENQLGFQFDIAAAGHWYGANVVSAHQWPLETARFKVDPFFADSNQTSPVWLTSSGTAIIAETYQTMGFSMNDPVNGIFEFHVKNTRGFTCKIVIGNHIRDAYYGMINLIGKPQIVPPREYFVYPIFNTWIEFMTKVNQTDVVDYVNKIRENKFPVSVFDIDDKWTNRYGDMEFDPAKFPDPAKMMNDLRNNGLKVALWVTPFIEKEAKNYQIALENHYLIMDESGKQPFIAKWWNGFAAIVDLSNPKAYDWFLGMLKNLRAKYGIDGFKLDAGDAEFLNKPFNSYGNITANQYTDLFAGLGNYFDINELRVSWLTQKNGLVQRLRDKAPTWALKDGIGSIVPHAMCQSILGYTFSCPDMIGGGLDGSFRDKDFKGMDTEMFVRWTQASALMPMMQFSYAPWKLDEKSVAICRKYADLHTQFGDYIYSLACKSKDDGTPIVRPLFFDFPNDPNTYAISDQFMLGDRILVAPVLEKGKTERKIYLPGGTWSDFWNGKIYTGGEVINYQANIDILPILIRIL